MLKSMLTHMREASQREVDGDEGAEAGFTLIELMVVLLIIAILLAIAIPTFLGVANSAGDRAAQSNLTNALTEAKALYQNAASVRPGISGRRHDGRQHSRHRRLSSPGFREPTSPVVGATPRPTPTASARKSSTPRQPVTVKGSSWRPTAPRPSRAGTPWTSSLRRLVN